MPTVQRVYHRWTGERKVQRAEAAFAKGDYETAILNARGALATNAKDLEALRVMARTADALGAPQALEFRRQIEAIDPNDPENLIGLAEVSIKAGNVNAAEQALKSVPVAHRTATRYHDAAAGIAWAQKDAVDFESHTEEALKLAPADDSYRLKLAALRLAAKSPDLRAAALAALDELKEKPSTSSAARRALLRDAMDRGERDRALELANDLASAPGASLGDKLTRLSAWDALLASQAKSPIAVSPVSKQDLYSRLGEIQEETATQPELIAKVVVWMNEHHMALQVPDWVAALPVEMVSNPSLRAAVAESHALASNWTKLKEFLESGSWEKLEYQRFAFLSRAYQGIRDHGSAATAWSRAVEAAQANPGSLQQLIADASKWGWEEKAEELLWKLAAKGQSPRWVGDALWSIALKRSDAPSLYKASKLLLEAEPKSVSARNSFIHLALITQQDEAGAHLLAETLYKENSSDYSIAPTYAFSLFRQNRPDEAAGVLAKLPKEKLQEPWLALYQGLFLSAAGQPDEAEEYIRRSAAASLLPEMESIRRLLSALFEAKQFEREGKLEECAVAWRTATEAAGARPEWLELLAKVAIKWDWEDKAGEVLSKLVRMGRCPSWGIPALWSFSLKSGESAEIYKAAKLVLGTNPKDFEARKNFIIVALLTGKSADSPHQLAEELHREDPSNVEGAAAYCLSLYRQGQFEQALALLRGLKAEQLRHQRPALYLGMVLAALGHDEEAEQSLEIGTRGPMLPEEKEIADTLGAAFQWRASQQRGDIEASDATWARAIAASERRPKMMETLGRMLLQWGAAEKATEVLWKLTGTPECPRWVIDHLWTDSEKRRDSAKLYQLSRLLRRAAPEDLTFRNNFVRLSLLTGQDSDFPHRLADALLDENPGNPDVAATCGLSFLQRKKHKEAVAVLAALKPEQLQDPRVAYYYGIVLTASGQAGKAQEYLRIGSERPLLREEENLLATVTSVSAKNALP